MKTNSKNIYNNSVIFDQIEEKAKLKGLRSIKDISAQVNLSPASYTGLKNGNRSLKNCRRRTIEPIAEYIGLPISQVYLLIGIKASQRIDQLSKSALYIRFMREQLKLTRQDASIYFGLGKNAFSLYEAGRVEPPFLLLLVLKILEDRPDYIDEMDELVFSPDQKQAIPTYFSYIRRKFKIQKGDAVGMFGLGKGAFTQIELGYRKPSSLLLMMFKILELHPEIFSKIKLLSASRHQSQKN